MITDLPNKYPAFGLDHCLGAYLQPSDTNIEFRTRLQMKQSLLCQPTIPWSSHAFYFLPTVCTLFYKILEKNTLEFLTRYFQWSEDSRQLSQVW